MKTDTTETYQKFKKFLEENNISVSSLAPEMNISRFHLGEVLKGNRKLYDSLKDKLNAYLNTNY